MKAVKRTGTYRETRNILSCVAPEDVWTENSSNTIVVAFAIAEQPDRTLCFAVDGSTLSVVSAGIVKLGVSGTEWRVINEGIRA